MNDKLTLLRLAHNHEAARSSNGIIKPWYITCNMKKTFWPSPRSRMPVEKNLQRVTMTRLQQCKIILRITTSETTRSSATAKSTARASCLVGVLYDISREKICWWLSITFT